MTDGQKSNATSLTELYLHHGWGFDASCWQSFQAGAPENWKFTIADRGYSCQPQEIPSFTNSSAIHVAVAHSFGLHLLPDAVLRACDLLVIIGSFQQYDPDARTSLRRMHARLKIDPASLLADFFSNCFGGGSSPIAPEKVDSELLQSDLKRLEKNCLDITPLKSIPAVLLLHGRPDTIVQLKQSELLHEQIPSSVLHIHEDGTHALPFTHPEWCRHHIMTMLNGLPEHAVATAEGKR